MSIIDRIIKLFIKPDKEIILGEFRRNDLCYCASGLKYKKCHELILKLKKQTAYRVLNLETKQESIKIFKTNSRRVKSNLRWEDIGHGGMGKIDP